MHYNFVCFYCTNKIFSITASCRGSKNEIFRLQFFSHVFYESQIISRWFLTTLVMISVMTCDDSLRLSYFYCTDDLNSIFVWKITPEIRQRKISTHLFYKIGVVLLWSQLTITSLTGYLEADCEKYLALREPNNDFLTINNKYGLKVMHKYTVLVFCILILCHTIHFDTLHIFRRCWFFWNF